MDGNTYAEVVEVLDNMSLEDKNKIPKKVYDFFIEKSSKSYIKHLNKKIPLCKQDIREDTKEILAILLINYWCETENEKNDLLKVFRENELKYQQELCEKYNPDNIFENKRENKSKEQVEEKALIVVQEEKWYQRILSIIKGLFKRT